MQIGENVDVLASAELFFPALCAAQRCGCPEGLDGGVRGLGAYKLGQKLDKLWILWYYTSKRRNNFVIILIHLK